ncbi:hypothetical protein AABM26_10045 [Curtobacterium aetherium]|uniref:hypothetical protein n=1 Tax=Curtobacterium aetherium TaxID=2841594 RepID=UPI003B52E6D9
MVAVLSAVAAIVLLVALAVDHRELVGAPLWAKPLKFALSIAVYALTLAHLIPMIRRFRTVLWLVGLCTAVALGLELVMIVAAAARDTTSHFNFTDTTSSTVYVVMAASIGVVWTATLVVAVFLFRAPLGDRARRAAVRAGVALALVGMSTGFLMVGPTGAQLADYRGIVGAHTVGAPDGGPGLPGLGWSTVAGDLRVPHFLGMHALQLLPLLALTTELLARRVAALRSDHVRARMVLVGAAAWVGVVGIALWQALRGQSVVQADGATLVAGVLLLAATATATVAVVRAAATPDSTDPLPHSSP